jgi:transposase
MSMQPQPIGPVPQDTARVARAAFPKGNVYMEMRNVLGSIYDDEDFLELFEVRGRPAIAPWRLALVTLMQFSEGLSDRQAAEAVRARIDWKYALGLKLSDPGFDFSVLSESRSRLVAGGAEHLLLESLLEACKERGYLKVRGRQRTDSTHVLGALRVLSKWEQAAETMRAALNALAATDPAWLTEHADPEWCERYARRIEDQRLPKGKKAREQYLKTVGADGLRLLGQLEAPHTPEVLKQGDKHSLAINLNNLAMVVYSQGDLGRAAQLTEEAVALFRELGARGDVALGLYNLGWIASLQDDHGRAADLYAESLTLSWETGLNPLVQNALEGLACVAAARIEAERAAGLWGAAQTLHQTKGILKDTDFLAEADARISAVRLSMGEEAWEEAWHKGRAMTLDEAVSYALEGEEEASG